MTSLQRHVLTAIVVLLVVTTFFGSFYYADPLGITGKAVATIAVAQNGQGAARSINDAVRMASPGDTIEIIDSGVYRENVQISKDITLRAAPGQTPILEGRDEELIDYVVTIAADAKLQNLQVIPGRNVEGGVLIRRSRVGAILENMYIDKAKVFGVYVAAKAAIANSTIKNAASTGVYVAGADAKITGSYIADNIVGIDITKNGVATIDTSYVLNNNNGVSIERGEASLSKSTIVKNDNNAIMVEEGNLIVEESIMAYNAHGIRLGANNRVDSTVVSRNNIYFENSVSDTVGEVSIAGDYNVDPQFRDTTSDFRLDPDSVLVGRANDDGNIGADQVTCKGCQELSGPPQEQGPQQTDVVNLVGAPAGDNSLFSFIPFSLTPISIILVLLVSLIVPFMLVARHHHANFRDSVSYVKDKFSAVFDSLSEEASLPALEDVEATIKGSKPPKIQEAQIRRKQRRLERLEVERREKAREIREMERKERSKLSQIKRAQERAEKMQEYRKKELLHSDAVEQVQQLMKEAHTALEKDDLTKLHDLSAQVTKKYNHLHQDQKDLLFVEVLAFYQELKEKLE